MSMEIASDGRLEQMILDVLPDDPAVARYLPYFKDTSKEADEETRKALEPFTMEPDGLLLHEGLIYVPAVDEIKLEILRSCHDGKAAGHLGQEKTLELISRDYYWPGMRRFTKDYVWTCETCARRKAPRHRRHGKLHPLPIPAGP